MAKCLNLAIQASRKETGEFETVLRTCRRIYTHTHTCTHTFVYCITVWVPLHCFALFFFFLFTFEKHSPNGCYARPQPYAECLNEGGMEDGTYYSYKQKRPARKWTKQKENENTKQNKTL